MSDKISPQHLARKAMLYIRQSSTYQVSHNVESQRLQYAMQDRLHQLGWQEIEVVDEDLGRSAAGMVTRAGFERMVADVCFGKVGAVAAREVSRFARNSPAVSMDILHFPARVVVTAATISHRRTSARFGELNGVSERQMITPDDDSGPTTAALRSPTPRSRPTHGERDDRHRLGIPRSTTRGWLEKAPKVVVRAISASM
jgi:Resolvase, N terminal domain